MKEINKEDNFLLVQDIAALIENSKIQLVLAANSSLTLLFWHIGKRINDEILKNERAEYGQQIMSTVSAQLELKYGRNFTEKNVRRMVRFYVEFPDYNILPPLAAQLSWSHFIELFPLKSIDSKLYYAHNALEQN